MGKEQEASQEETVVTDDMLSRAADAVVETEEVETEETATEEETEETVETEEAAEETSEETEEPVVEEPDSAAERSRLGRKVKRQEDTIQMLMKRLEQLEGKTSAKVEEDDDLDDDDYVKKSDIPKIIEKREQKKTQERTAYESRYLSKVVEIGNNEEMDEELYDEIVEAMETKFNKILTGDPVVDAKLNFSDAHVAVLRQRVEQAGKPKNPLKGGKPKVATGVGGGMDTKTKAPKPAIKLDAHAADLVREMGITPERASEILAQEDKPHLNFNKGR